MTKYQLLRSNKQSGPYTIEDLQAMGLKPFDLIWVEGKSFSWRYPSEIDELKHIAPSLDTAPLINTLSSAQEAKASPIASASTAHVYAIKPNQNESRVQNVQVPSQETPKDPAPRIIVEEEQLRASQLEKEAEPTPAAPADPPREDKKADIKELYIVHSQRKNEETKNEDATRLNETGKESRNPETHHIEKKFSDRFRRVDEKRLEVKELIPVRPIRKRDLTDTLMLVFMAVALLFTGYLIGAFYSNKHHPEENNNSANNQVQSDQSPPTLETPEKSPEEVTTVAPVQAEKPKPVAKQPRKEKKAEDNSLSPSELQLKKDVASAEEQKQKEASEKEQDKAQARATIYQNIRLKANDYRKVFLGGISDLKITVNNGSKYILDEVVVEVSYLKNNKDVIKMETLHFQNLLPGAEATVVAPDSKRGSKIDYRVLQVKSKDLGM